jgi:hypothetical protein
MGASPSVTKNRVPFAGCDYLNELDHLLASAGYEMTRDADDLVIQCRTLEDAQAALEDIASSNTVGTHDAKV